MVKINLKLDNNFSLRFSAIDGTFHEIFTEDGIRSFVVVGEVMGRIEGSHLILDGIKVNSEVYECRGEEAMRKAEYEQARSSDADVVFMDRKVSFDSSFNVETPQRFFAIVKDFDPLKRKEMQEDPNAPWIKVENEGKFTSGFFRLFPFSWVFMFETNVYSREILDVLLLMGNVPIPEALGYNYPLFLADKLVKYYRDKEYRGIEMRMSPSRYRDFRGEVEHLRRVRRFF